MDPNRIELQSLCCSDVGASGQPSVAAHAAACQAAYPVPCGGRTSSHSAPCRTHCRAHCRTHCCSVCHAWHPKRHRHRQRQTPVPRQTPHPVLRQRPPPLRPRPLAAPAGPHAAQRCPGLGGVGFCRHLRRPRGHQLPRRQPTRPRTRALPPPVFHPRRRQRRPAIARRRRPPRPRLAAPLRQARAGPPHDRRALALPPRRPSPRQGGAHLLHGQPARCGLCRRRRHLQRLGRAQLRPAHLLLRLHQSWHERRPRAGRGRRSGGRQRLHHVLLPADELPRPWRPRRSAAGPQPRRHADEGPCLAAHPRADDGLPG